MRAIRTLSLAFVLGSLLAPQVRAQVGCTVMNQAQLLASFGDNVPKQSITPAALRNFVCSVPTFGTTGNFTDLNVSGVFSAASGGGLAGTFTGNPVFSGNPSFAGNPVFAGTPSFSSLSLPGAGTALSVTNNAAIGGNLTVTGTLAAGGISFTNLALPGSLSVTGASTLGATSAGNTSVVGTFGVTGASSLGALTAGVAGFGATSVTSLNASGTATLASALFVAGATTVAALTASGVANLNGLLVAPGGANFSGRTFLGGSLAKGGRVVTIAGPVTVSVNDQVVELNKTVGAITVVNLPACNANAFLVQTVIDGKGDATTNPIILTPSAGLINGAATYVMNNSGQSVNIFYDGTRCVIF